MECSVRIRRQLVELFKYRELLGLECVATRAEGIKRLPVTEKDSLLTFVYYKLRAEVEVLYRMLPHKSIVISLVFDYARQPVLFDALLRKLALNIVHAVADGAGTCMRVFRGNELNSALCAGKLLYLCLVGHFVYLLMADGADSRITLTLVENDIIAAVGALAARQLICLYIKGITAAAGYFLCAKQTRTKQT